MGNPTNAEHWAARERLRRIEFILWWCGRIGRADLIDRYGISAAQASGDLQKYTEVNPGALIYHTSRKRYESSPEMRCVLHEPSFDEAMRDLFGAAGSKPGWLDADGEDPRLAVLNLAKRRVDPAITRRVLVALFEERWVRVRYRSLASGTDSWRRLVPGGLGWDGWRWHLRAWCEERGEWRDFVLGRMLATEWPVEDAPDLPKDTAWHKVRKLRLRLNPKLSEGEREALRADYGLRGDVLEIPVRDAMRDYLLASYFIETPGRSRVTHFVADER